MHSVIRRYTGATKLLEEMDRRHQEIERLLSAAPGFVADHAIRDGDTLVTVTICRDREGSEEITRSAAEWVRENGAAGVVGAPEITEGTVFLDFGVPRHAAAGHA